MVLLLDSATAAYEIVDFNTILIAGSVHSLIINQNFSMKQLQCMVVIKEGCVFMMLYYWQDIFLK